MSNPTAQAGSTFAQGKAVQSNVSSKFKQGKAVQTKAATFNKGVLKHMLLFLFMGVILGCTAFIPMFSFDYPVTKIVYVVIASISLLFGWWSLNRATRKIEWYDGNRFFPQFLLAFGVCSFLFLGLILVYFLADIAFAYLEYPYQLILLFGAGSITSFIPLLFNSGFERAWVIEPKAYRLWVYPENYIEKQPTWNRERIIFANLNFKRRENENLVTTVKVKLPKEAILGELLYLFIKDYNENRSPDAPIQQLLEKQGVSGWKFLTKNTGPAGLFKKFKVLDTDQSVEANRISEESHLFFERIMAN
jgi:hypothetical protein